MNPPAGGGGVGRADCYLFNKLFRADNWIVFLARDCIGCSNVKPNAI